MTISNAASALSQKIVENSPAILTGIGAVGVIATSVLAARGAVQANEDIREVEESGPAGIPEPLLTNKEKFRLTWKRYLPAVVAGSVTIACVISAQSINSRRNAVLMSLYTISERGLTEFREKSREIHGDSKVEKIYDEIAKDRVNSLEPEEFWYKQIEVRGDGVGMCKDMYSDRYFVSSRNEIDAAVNTINHQINTESYASLNDFYNQIGLGSTGFGEEVGWVLGGLLDVQYTYVPAEDGSPCMAVTFKRQPVQDFQVLWR